MPNITSFRYVLFTPFLAALSFAQPQTVIVPQIADGGGWQTTLVLTNTITGVGSASMSFYQETSGGATQSWNLAFSEQPTQNVRVNGGATVLLHTLGTGSTTSVGWAQMIVSPGIVAYAIFTQRMAGHTDQDGTAPGGSVTQRVLVPFDNTGGSVTSVAMANPSSAAETVSVNIATEAGAVSQASISLPAQGHMAFALPDQLPATAGHSGLAEFYLGSGRAVLGNISMIALRFNPTGGFTTAPVYEQTGAPIVGVPPPSGTR